MSKKGFTLIELLIVIAIIGIVVAIAIPNLMTALQKAKQKSSMGDMKNIGTSIESYVTDNIMAPGGGGITTVAGLIPHLIPFHTKAIRVEDGWSSQFQYESGAAGSSTEDYYSVISYGRRGQSDAMDINNSPYSVTRMADFNNDICFSNGIFSYGPKVN